MASVTTGVGIFETGQTIATWDRYARDVYFCLLVTVIEREPCPRWYCKDVTSVPDFLVEFLLPLRLWVLPLQQQLKPQRKPEVFSGGFFEVKCGLNFSLFLSRKKTGYFIWYFWYIIRDITWMSYSVLVFLPRCWKKLRLRSRTLLNNRHQPAKNCLALMVATTQEWPFVEGLDLKKGPFSWNLWGFFMVFPLQKTWKTPKNTSLLQETNVSTEMRDVSDRSANMDQDGLLLCWLGCLGSLWNTVVFP